MLEEIFKSFHDLKKNIKKAVKNHLQTCCREGDKNKPWVLQTDCIKNTLSVATPRLYSGWKSFASVQVIFFIQILVIGHAYIQHAVENWKDGIFTGEERRGKRI